MKEDIIGNVILAHLSRSSFMPTKHVRLKEVIKTKKFRLLAIPNEVRFYSVLMEEDRVEVPVP